MIWKLNQCSPLALLAVLAGCAQQDIAPTAPVYDASRNPELIQPDLYPNGAPSDPQVRYGRYTLVNTAPEIEQRDLMAQIIDINIPGNMHPTVHDAMQYVVNRSGYSVCGPEQDHVNILFTRPLPAAQYKLGPMSLRNTLQVLAGPAWQVKVDEVTRSVCFVLRPGYRLPVSQQIASRSTTKPEQPSSTTDAPSSQTTAKQIPTTPSVDTSASVPSLMTKASATIKDASPASPIVSSVHKDPMPGDASATPEATPEKKVTRPAKEGHPTPPATTIKSQPVLASAAAPTRGTATSSSLPEPAKDPVPPAAQSTETWEVPVGSTLRQSVENWAKRAGWQVIWEANDLDYPIEAALHFKGSFAEAIGQIFPLYDSARRSFIVDGNAAQRIVHVSERQKS